MRIKNINGTSQATCSCGSWLKHWEKFSDQIIPPYCPVAECTKKDLVGAHVQKANSSDTNWYIYPLCSTHNQYTGELEIAKMEIYEKLKLVSANKSETCGE